MDSLRKALLDMRRGLGHLQEAQVPLGQLDNLQEVFNKLLSSYDLLGSIVLVLDIEERQSVEKTTSLLD